MKRASPRDTGPQRRLIAAAVVLLCCAAAALYIRSDPRSDELLPSIEQAGPVVLDELADSGTEARDQVDARESVPSEPVDEAPSAAKTIALHRLLLVDRASDEPIEGVLVGQSFTQATGESSSLWPPHCAVSDSEGLVELSGHLRGTRELALRSRDYGPARLHLDLLEQPQPNPLVITLDRAATLRGRIIGLEHPAELLLHAETGGDELTRPAGAPGRSMPSEHWYRRLAKDGSFELRGLAPDVPLELELVSDRLWRDELIATEPLYFAAGEVREVTWNLNQRTAVTGIVLDRAGRPVSDLHVWIGLGDDIASDFRERTYAGGTQTDSEGRFTLPPQVDGTYLVGVAQHASDDLQLQVSAQDQFVELHFGSPAPSVEFVVARGLYVRGRILLPDGTGVRGVTFYLDQEGMPQLDVWSGNDGRFLIGPLVPGPCYIESDLPYEMAHYGWIAPLWVDAESPEELELRLVPGARIEGFIKDPQSGDCVEGFTLLESLEDGRALTDFGSVDCDFYWLSIPAGLSSLSAQTTDGRAGYLKGLHFVAGESRDDIAVPVGPAGQLRVLHRGTRGDIRVHVRCEGVLMGRSRLSPGEDFSVYAPVGIAELVVDEVRPFGDQGPPVVLERRSIVVVAGEVFEVSIER